MSLETLLFCWLCMRSKSNMNKLLALCLSFESSKIQCLTYSKKLYKKVENMQRVKKVIVFAHISSTFPR
jgi:hypothetical protein